MREPVSPLLEALADAPGDNSATYCGGVRRRLETFLGSPERTRRRKRGREECRGGTGKSARRLEMIRTRHRGFVGEGATLEQSGENEEQVGEKHLRMGKKKVE